MPFEAIVGNEAALARLRGSLERGRLAQAYLFAGPEGVGKKFAAIEFARALAARAILVARPEDRHEVLIAQVREVIRELSLTSKERRVVIFDDAERMSEDAMNALLKTLEEPPSGTVLILVTSLPERLLPTLRSRCQTIFFFPLSDEDMTRYAREKLGLGEEEAGAAALLSGGSVGAATRLAPQIRDVIAKAAELQARVLAGELNPVVEALGKMRDTEEARAAAKQGLSFLSQCLREVLRSKVGGRSRLATPAFVDRFSRLDEDDLLEKIETLLEHQRLIDLNANVSLAVEDALLRL